MSLSEILTQRRDALALAQKQATAQAQALSEQIALIDKAIGAIPADIDGLLDAIGLTVAIATP